MKIKTTTQVEYVNNEKEIVDWIDINEAARFYSEYMVGRQDVGVKFEDFLKGER